MDKTAIQEAVLASFKSEVNALKPGNVSRYADGHDMTMDDFIRSADLTTPILCNTGTSIGERILGSVQVTDDVIGCNTNLGMLLLFAPLIKAAERYQQHGKSLREWLRLELETMGRLDADLVFTAIRLANPGGLGQSDAHDVISQPDCGLLEAMGYASQKDRIAYQYTSGFKDIFTTGLTCIKDFTRRWNNVEWATVACYLTQMAGFPDSHIQRKYGTEVAEKIRIRTGPIAQRFKESKQPEKFVEQLLDFDKELKETNINPGTCADLTAASLLVYKLAGE
jgi:triphosphoribosyl-dephospho-CoA synthase